MMSDRPGSNVTVEDIEDYEIPEGLSDLLHEFAVSVLIEKPANLHTFAADYFTKLRDEKKTKTIPMYIIVDDDNVAGEPEIRKLTEKNQAERRKSVSAERYNPEEDSSDDEESLPIHPKSDKQRELLTEAVKHILLFRKLDDEQRMTVIDAMVEKKVVTGDVVIRQGDDGDYFYVIGDGIYDIYRMDEKSKEEKKVNSFDNEGSFGELALMYSQPRSATVIASTPGVLWALDRKSFQRIVTKESFKNRKMYEKLLSQVPFLKALSDEERSSVVDGLCTRVFYDNDTIISVGEEGDGIYFLENGVCSVRINKGQGETEVKRLTNGQYFGELALLDNSKRSASIYAVGKVKCGFLARESFERLLGPCKDIMKRATNDYI